MKDHIFLVGFMGSGKTTTGKKLSKKINIKFYDTDEAIVKKDGRQISNIFKESGEGYFRRLESLILRELPDERMVISCGGGMAIRQENVDIMKEVGQIVYLSATPQVILERVKKSNKRPILEGNKNIEFISELMSKRVPYYEKAADIKINCDDKSADEVTESIIARLT